MSLDFHISHSSREAERQHPVFSIDEPSHALFVQSANSAATPIKLIARIEDFYSDTEFLTKEIDELIIELRTLEGKTADEGTLRVVHDLLGICEKTLNAKANLYVFCD